MADEDEENETREELIQLGKDLKLKQSETKKLNDALLEISE